MASRLFRFLFRKKQSKSLLLFILFIFSSFSSFAQSKVISTLSLDFTRTETIEENGQTATLKGRIIYSKSPFFFLFQTDAPFEQKVFLTSQGAFLTDEENIIQLDESDSLKQICDDFLNWFKDDFGLRESFFIPQTRTFEDGQVVTQWDYSKQDSHPVDTVIVNSDSNGRITMLKMYLDFSTLLTKTRLDDYKYFAGKAFPTTIVSTSYDNNEAVLTTKLNFSNISFNQNTEKLFQTSKITLEDITEARAGKDLSRDTEIIHPLLSTAKTYDVSIPSVLLKSSFKFYKKFITNQDMTNCPFYPSCSQYMVDAVNQNGVFGLIQGLERLKRCTSTEHKRDLYPTLSNGKHYDPVPAKKSKGETK